MSDDTANWHPFDGGRSIGTRGSESGTILRDDEHELGARITLERDAATAPFAITCGIYGWMLHTRWFSKEEDAQRDYVAMTQALDQIMLAIPLDSDVDRDARIKDTRRSIGEFVGRFA